MNFPARVIAFLLLLFSAELAASWWIWGRAPTDSIRVWYSGFIVFEAGRMRYWVPLFAGLAVLWIAAWYLFRRNGHLTAWQLLGAGLAVALEVLTSVLYWGSARSSDLRGLFQSIWAWHRVPQARDLGWPSFRIYLWNHLIPWAVVLIIGISIWLFKRGNETETPETQDERRHHNLP
jgi:hypothetical protein